VAPLLAAAALPVSASAAVVWPQSGMPLYANPLLEQSPTESSQPRPEEAARPTPAVVSWYAVRFHLSETEARARLAVEDRGMRMAGWEASALGSSFAGVWFNNHDGKYHVGIAPGANLAAAEQVTDQMEMTDETVFQPVRWNLEQLEAANAIVAQAMRPVEMEREAAVGTEASSNDVEITLSKTGSRANREFAEQVAKAAPVSTAIVEQGVATPRVHPTSCSTRYDRLNGNGDTFCSKPLRGAAGMDDNTSGTECSVGGVAFRGGNAYVVTAGHCLVGELGHYWSTVETSTGRRHNIGKAEQAVDGNGGDAGLINETGGYWETPNSRYVDVDDESSEYGLEGVLESFDGMYQCWIGAQSNAHNHLACGTLVATNVSEGFTSHLDESYGPPDGKGHELCLYDGDSGGPVITGHYLDGLISAGSTCGEHEYAATYMPAPSIERYYGVEFVDAMF
jgi:hypothetical protein